jgi:hypothetical protein
MIMNTENQEDRREGTIYQAQREAGRNYRRFATELEGRGWKFLPDLPEGANSGDKLRSLIDETISVAIAELAFQDGTYSRLRTKIAYVFYLGEISGFTKYRNRVREWIRDFPEGY